MKRKRRTKKEKLQTKIFSAILGVSIFIIAGFLIFSNWKIAKKRNELLLKIDSLKKQIQTTQTRNEQLRSGISESEEQDYWETRIREQGYQKPGETAVVIKKQETAEQTQESRQNIWEKLLAEVRGIFE